ncbi:MAG: class I SAM-dependent methyltransferase [Proteobacteria bacterium]|nr:class I SAM-dependent methyltransferase [Pseudomonadota bacterium]MBU1709834.1 class I SAM-dependent methyltransferase [Pseudomonadota bacterium]
MDNFDFERAKKQFQPPASLQLIKHRQETKSSEIIGIIKDDLLSRKINKALSIGASYCLIESEIKTKLLPDVEFHCTDFDKGALESFDQPALIKKFISATELEFPEENFDFIMAHQVLEHINDYPVVLKSIEKFCRPKGIIYINVPNPFSPFIVAKKADGTFDRPFIKRFFVNNFKKFKKDFMSNTEKYHTGFTYKTLRKHFPESTYQVVDKRRTRLKQEFSSSFLKSLVDFIPSILLFLIVPTNIWILIKK